MPMEPKTMTGRILKRMLMESLEERRKRERRMPTAVPPTQLPESDLDRISQIVRERLTKRETV